MRIAAYTVITGEYDNLRKPAKISAGVDYICFTDIPRDVEQWEVWPFPMLLESDRRNSRIPKILPHLFLEDYDVSVYVDGAFKFQVDLAFHVPRLLGSSDMALFEHPGGHKSYHDERNFYQQLHGYVPEDVELEYQGMCRAQVPVSGKFYAGGVIIRRNNEKVAAFNERWMRYHRGGSNNDQFSLYRAIQESGVQVATIPGSITTGEMFGYCLHANSKCGDNPKFEAHNEKWRQVRNEIRRICFQ